MGFLDAIAQAAGNVVGRAGNAGGGFVKPQAQAQSNQQAPYSSTPFRSMIEGNSPRLFGNFRPPTSPNYGIYDNPIIDANRAIRNLGSVFGAHANEDITNIGIPYERNNDDETYGTSYYDLDRSKVLERYGEPESIFDRRGPNTGDFKDVMIASGPDGYMTPEQMQAWNMLDNMGKFKKTEATPKVEAKNKIEKSPEKSVASKNTQFKVNAPELYNGITNNIGGFSKDVLPSTYPGWSIFRSALERALGFDDEAARAWNYRDDKRPWILASLMSGFNDDAPLEVLHMADPLIEREKQAVRARHANDRKE